jgi:predicted DNA-binding protein YlxM (UPF0122 family)
MAKGYCNVCYARLWARKKSKETPKKVLFKKSYLASLYLNQKLSASEIAKINNVSRPTVVRWLKKYNIEIRSNKLSQETFLKKCKDFWQDKYDLSETIYKTAKEPIVVICPIRDHGRFKVNDAYNFSIGKSQCPKCQLNQKLNFDIFFSKAKKIHNNSYLYTYTKNISYKDKVLIKCPTHGDFFQNVGAHLSGNGCPKCASKKRAISLKKKTSCLIEEFRSVHGYKYDYSKVEYSNNNLNIVITCKLHGDFEQLPSNHLAGKGCRKCGYGKSSVTKTSNTNEFLQKAYKLWGETFDYSKVNYKTAKNPIIITCRKHGDFEITPDKHLNGRGCQRCSTGGFDKGIPAIMYYLRINNNGSNLFKIGITNRSVFERFSDPSDRKKISVIKVWNFKTGDEAYKKEQNIIKKHILSKYKGPEILLGGGNTELFKIDILDLYKD